MKQNFLSNPCLAGAATAALSSSLFLAGCSGGQDSQGSEEKVTTVANFGFSKSETLALRKAGAGRKDMEKAIMTKKVDELKARGVDVQIVSPGRKTKGRG